MTSTLQIVDDALTTVLFDLNDPTGVANAESGSVMTEILADGDFASPAVRSSQVNYASADGGTTAFRRAGLTISEFGMTMKATSYDNLAAGVNRLSTLLARGGVMKWIPQGSAETRYIDFEPSETPALVNGQELGLWEVIQLFSKPHGVMVRITRQPYLRGPELDSNNNKLTNATLCLDRTADFAPDDWAWDVTTNITNASVTAARECFSFDVATTATRNLQQTTPNSSLTSGNTHTLAVYARASAGGIARLEEVWQGLTNAGATQGAEVVSTQTTLTTTWQRISVSANLAASSTKAQVSHRFRNAAATSVRVDLRNVVLTQAATAPPFYVGTAAVDYRIANGAGRVAMFYNPGSAPAPVTVKTVSAAVGSRMFVAPLSSGGVAGANSVTDYAYSDVYGTEAEDMTQGTNTTTTTIGSNYSGAGTNASVTTFATSNNLTVTRLTKNYTSDIASLRGRAWAVCIVVGDSSTGGTFNVGFRYSVGPASVTLNTNHYVTAVTTAGAHLPTEVFPGTLYVPPKANSLDLYLIAERLTGATNLEWDFVSLVPLDGLGFAGGDVDSDVASADTEGIETNPGEMASYTYNVADDTRDGVLFPNEGPMPLTAPPGLSVLYAGMDDPDDTFPSAVTSGQTVTFRTVFSPRYHA